MGRKKKNNNYYSDKKVTRILLRDIRLYKEGKIKKPSDELGKIYSYIVKKIIGSKKFWQYSMDVKEEFYSRSYIEFTLKWKNFNPRRNKKNYKDYDIKNGELVEKVEYRGGFGYLSMIAYTSILQEIKKFKTRNNYSKLFTLIANDILKEKNSKITYQLDLYNNDSYKLNERFYKLF